MRHQDAARTKFQTEMESFMSFLTQKKKQQQKNPTRSHWGDWRIKSVELRKDLVRRISSERAPCPPEERGGRCYLHSARAEEGCHKDYMEIVCLVVREAWLLFKSCLEMVKGKDRSASCSDGRNKLGWDVRDWSTPGSFSIFPMITAWRFPSRTAAEKGRDQPEQNALPSTKEK